MTDEEKFNEKLKQCGIDTEPATLEELKCRYPQYVERSHNEQQIEETLQRNAKNIGGGFDSEVLNYINRLKRNTKRIQKNWDIAVSVQRAKWKKRSSKPARKLQKIFYNL